jgi:hypothetical protein
MRARVLLAAAAAALLVPAVSPAQAGTGVANWCGDGATQPGGRDIPILASPITVGVEIQNDPTSIGTQQVRVCFSDTPEGQPSRVVGGEVAVAVVADGSISGPDVFVRLECIPDIGPTGAFPTCWTPVGAHLATDEVQVTTPNSSICLVSLGAGCVAYLPGVKVNTDGDPSRPLLALDLLGVPLQAGPPATCVAVIVTCP